MTSEIFRRKILELDSREWQNKNACFDEKVGTHIFQVKGEVLAGDIQFWDKYLVFSNCVLQERDNASYFRLQPRDIEIFCCHHHHFLFPPVGHRVTTISLLHRVLCFAIAWASSPARLISLSWISTVLLQVVLGLPLFLCLHVSAYKGNLRYPQLSGQPSKWCFSTSRLILVIQSSNTDHCWKFCWARRCCSYFAVSFCERHWLCLSLFWNFSSIQSHTVTQVYAMLLL